MALVEISCGDKKHTVSIHKMSIKTLYPGCMILGKDDLYDMGFKPEEIDKAGEVTITILDSCEGNVVLKVEKWPKG